MSSPFSKNRGPVLKCKRDTHDLSFQNNLTCRFGTLYPVLCKEVSAGDSWHIQSAFGLRFLPTYFPLQTKMKAKLDLFYVRFRNLWTDWKNYRYGTGNPSAFPILSAGEAKEQSKTGSLGDYLGLPTTLVGNGVVGSYVIGTIIPTNTEYDYSSSNTELEINSKEYRMNKPSSQYKKDSFVVWRAGNSNSSFSLGEVKSWTISDPKTPGVYRTHVQFAKSTLDARSLGNIVISLCVFDTDTNKFVIDETFSQFDYTIDDQGYFCVYGSGSTAVIQNKFVGKTLVVYSSSPSSYDIRTAFTDNNGIPVYPSWRNANEAADKAFNVVEATAVIDKIPYEINALPFRAYEQIYNSFYRDDRNNPFMVNGVYDPNIFIPTSEGGVDSTPYRLRQRNWEQDFLTSAVPSPQYGNAPLVGITSSASGVASLTLDDGSVIQSQLEYDENDNITGFSTTNSPEVNRKLINLASSGISINDLRGVNALQKYLELHYRRGLRYRDQMFAHRGIEIGYDELDMPEFIGSVVQSIDVSQINQTSASNENDPLGSYAGQLSAVGGSDRMSKYCDEDGLILGILSIVPVPAYSQLLPKLFTKVNDPLEYFDPSFRNLGYQSIPYREVCPLQAYNSGINLNDTFGYNRAWYDYLQSQDEIHGQFRTTLNNYVMARVFNSVPSLTPEFLTVNPDDLNDVFSVSNVTLDDGSTVQLDTILGQVHFSISVERQIPAYAIPGLE